MRRTADIGTGIIAQTDAEVNGFGPRGCETGTVMRLFRRGVIVGAVATVAYAAWRVVASQAASSDGPGYETQPFPMPPRPVPARPETDNSLELPGPNELTGTATAIEPDGDGNCPLTYPIKGKLSTGIYHRPGAFAYERTRADRCYRDETAAQADGLRAAKR